MPHSARENQTHRKERMTDLWIISLLIVGISNILAGDVLPSTFYGTLIGVTALIFLAKGNVWGQILTVVFSILYAITAYKFKYFALPTGLSFSGVSPF